MPKYRVGIEDRYVYSILVEADNEGEACDIAREAVGDGSIDTSDAIDGRTEAFDWNEVLTDAPGPFPRAE